MKKYFKVYSVIMKANLSILLSFRANFYIHTFSSLLWGAFQIITILLLTSKTGSIGSWTKEELIILVVVFNIFIGLFHTVFSTSLKNLPLMLNEGIFDTLITKPLSSQFLVSSRAVYYPSLIRTLVSFGLLVYLLNLFNIEVSLATWILTIITGVLGVLLLYSIWMIVMTFCMWNPKLSNLFEALITFNGFSRFPETMLKDISLTAFTSSYFLLKSDFIEPINPGSF